MQKSLATGLISLGARNGSSSLLTVTTAAVPRRGWNSFLRTTITSNAHQTKIWSGRKEYHLSVVERAPRRKNSEAQEGGDPSSASQEGELVREQKEDGSVYERVNLPHEEEGEDSSDEEEEEEEDYDEEEEENEDEEEEAREAEEWAAAQHEVRTRNASDYTEIEGCYTPQSYDGIAAKPFPPDVADVLLEEIHPSWVEIKPDGTIYLPEIFYRRILNTAFGPGGWALMPRQAPEVHETTGQKIVTREYALYCLGRFVSQAGGEQQMFENIGLSTASESSKSQALMRCCKDLGVASSLWDPTYIAFWKSQFAVGVLCEHTKTGAKKVLWRRKDRKPFGFPWKEGKIMFQGDEEQGSGEDAFTTMMSTLSAPSKKATKADAKKEASEETEESHEGGEGEEEEGEQQQKQQQQPTVFDPEGVLPPQLKKYAGKKWKDVVRMPAGRDYLTYLVKNYQGESKLACQKALDWWNEQQNKK